MIRAIHLRTEYLTDPVGIDLAEPRIMWQVSESDQSAYQIAYRKNDGKEVLLPEVRTAEMYAELRERSSETADRSGIAATAPATAVSAGKPFISRDRVQWKVRLCDGTGGWGPWSAPASFEMGLLKPEDRSAFWIMGDYDHSSKAEIRYPADCFRKAFTVETAPIRARLYMTACGMYEACMNGEKIGDRVLAPGSTAFQTRVHEQVYDVTGLVQPGGNALTIELADGFYAGKTGCFGKAKTFGCEPKVLFQLELFFADGSIRRIVSDVDTEWSNDGPVIYADMKDGETVDSQKKPSYSGKARLTSYDGIICADNNVPVHEMERLTDPKVLKCPDGNTVLDFGQNIAGYMAFSVQGPAGHKVSMVFGEKRNENGNFTTRNISLKGEYTDERLQREEFICDGSRQQWKPKFTVMGFRYVLLLDWPEEVLPENFTAIAVYSDMAVTGHFECSDAGIDQIVKNTLWSMKGNFLDVPTDCPTRERAGWTGDAQLFFNTGNYMMDQAAFFRKWLQDLEDVQKENGMIYNINPQLPGGNPLYEWVSVEGGVGWGDAFLMIPYRYWKRYGDDRMIRQHWPAMEKCFNFYKKRIGKKNAFTFAQKYKGDAAGYVCSCGRDFGEWTEPEDCAPPKADLMKPHPEESTAYIAYDAGLMAEMAAHLGLDEAASEYGRLHRCLKRAYIDNFLGDGSFETGRMAKYVRPCALGLAGGKLRRKLLEQIVALNRKRDYKVGTGFLSTPFVLGLLTEAGESGDAYRMLTNPELGWMKQVNEGATTIWENWTDDASLNHYSKGACCGWLYVDVCGIRMADTESAAESGAGAESGAAESGRLPAVRFEIRPNPVPQLTYARMTYDSVYGSVESGWEKSEDGSVRFRVKIPANCSAVVKLPGKKAVTAAAGEHVYRIG